MKTVLAPNAPWPKEIAKIKTQKVKKQKIASKKIDANFEKWLENNNLKENLQKIVKRQKPV